MLEESAFQFIKKLILVDGEMDRLRILTTGNDYGPGLSQLPDLTHCGIKQESSSPPHYTLIKQEIAPANFVLKSELPDPQYDNSTYQKQSFKVNGPTPTQKYNNIFRIVWLYLTLFLLIFPRPLQKIPQKSKFIESY